MSASIPTTGGWGVPFFVFGRSFHWGLHDISALKLEPRTATYRSFSVNPECTRQVSSSNAKAGQGTEHSGFHGGIFRVSGLVLFKHSGSLFEGPCSEEYCKRVWQRVWCFPPKLFNPPQLPQIPMQTADDP